MSKEFGIKLAEAMKEVSEKYLPTLEEAAKNVLENIRRLVKTDEDALNMQNWDNWLNQTTEELARDRATLEHNRKIMELQEERLKMDLERANLNLTRYNEWREEKGLDEIIVDWQSETPEGVAIPLKSISSDLVVGHDGLVVAGYTFECVECGHKRIVADWDNNAGKICANIDCNGYYLPEKDVRGHEIREELRKGTKEGQGAEVGDLLESIGFESLKTKVILKLVNEYGWSYNDARNFIRHEANIW